MSQSPHPWGPAPFGVQSAVTLDECLSLYSEALLAFERGPGVAVELGAWLGRTSLVLAHACQAFGRVLHSVDPWCTYTSPAGTQHPSFDAWQRNVRAHESRIVAHRATSEATARAWSAGPSVRVLFVDADHTKADRDWAAWSPHLTPGALVAWHDYHLGWANVRQTVDGLVAEGALEWHGVAHGDGGPGLAITRTPQ